MSVFRSDGSYIYLNSQYVEFYIPMYYFDDTKRFAKDLGETIESIGMFNVGIFSNGKMKEMKTLNIPTPITLFVYDSEIRPVKLSNGIEYPCKVIKYLKDAKIMQSTLFEDDGAVKLFLSFLLSGKMPEIVPYSKILHLWMKNQSINKVNFGLSSFYLELVLSVLYRNPKNLGEKFSKIASKDGVSDYDYKTASIRQICQYNSTFTAITFEDIDSMITTSLNKTRDKAKEAESPLEQIIKY